MVSKPEESKGLPIVAGKILKMQNNFMMEILALYEKQKSTTHKGRVQLFINEMEKLQAEQAKKIEQAMEKAAPEEKQLYETIDKCNKSMVKELTSRLELLRKAKRLNHAVAYNTVVACNMILLGIVPIALGTFIKFPPLIVLGCVYIAGGAGILGVNVKPFFNSAPVKRIVPYLPKAIRTFLTEKPLTVRAQEANEAFKTGRSDFVNSVQDVIHKASDAMEAYKAKQSNKL